MKLRFAVCDDDENYAQYLSGLVERWGRQAQQAVETERFASAESFLFRYAEQKAFDVILLDIEMPGLDGVSLAKRLRKENECVQIVFITGYPDYIAEGYEVSALHYLTKPVDEAKLFEVLARAVGRLARNEPTVTLEAGGEMVRLPLREIRFLEVLHNTVTIHAKEDVLARRPLSELEKALDSRFFRVGRSYIVNLAYIRRVTRTEAELVTGERVPLPRGQYEKLNRAMIDRL